MRKKEVDPKKLLEWISIIESDIKRQLNPDKFQYWLADNVMKCLRTKNGRQDVPFIRTNLNWWGTCIRFVEMQISPGTKILIKLIAQG